MRELKLPDEQYDKAGKSRILTGAWIETVRGWIPDGIRSRILTGAWIETKQLRRGGTIR